MGYPHTKILDVYPDMCRFVNCMVGTAFPSPCDTHKDASGRAVCFKAWTGWTPPYHTCGSAFLSNPVDLATFLPSDTTPPIRRLVDVETYSSYAVAWGTVAWGTYANIKILTDDVARTGNLNLGPTVALPSWTHFPLTNLNIDLSNNINLDFELFMETTTSNYTEEHVGFGGSLSGALKLKFYYETTEAPPPSILNVTVLDTLTRAGVTGAKVTATSLSATFQATEAGGGLYQFTNIPEDSYTVGIFRNGYTYQEKTVDVTGTTSEIFYLVPGPSGLELPWWWWVVPVGLGGVALTWFIVKAAKPKKEREPPIYVVR